MDVGYLPTWALSALGFSRAKISRTRISCKLQILQALRKAIVVGRVALDVGLIMRVDDGSTISVWTDNSIPNTTMLKPMDRLGNDLVEQDSDLIVTHSGLGCRIGA